MPVQIDEKTLTRIGETANSFINIIFKEIKDDRGVHLETAISAPAFLAGTLILRATGVDLSALEPGQPVFVTLSKGQTDDVVNTMGMEVLGFMQWLCPLMGLDPATGWDQPVPADHQPLLPGIELAHRIEKPFLALMTISGIPGELYPYAAAFAGVRIISMGMQHLSQEIGKAVAVNSLVAGCKTVPYPP